MNEKPISSKERLFCETYVKGYNATQAYMEVYKVPHESASSNAYRLMKKEKIKNYIAELQKEAFEQACINSERVALKLAEIAFAEKGDEDYAASAQLKALDLLQKQLGLQQQKIDANVSNEIVINIEE